MGAKTTELPRTGGGVVSAAADEFPSVHLGASTLVLRNELLVAVSVETENCFSWTCDGDRERACLIADTSAQVGRSVACYFFFMVVTTATARPNLQQLRVTLWIERASSTFSQPSVVSRHYHRCGSSFVVGEHLATTSIMMMLGRRRLPRFPPPQ